MASDHLTEERQEKAAELLQQGAKKEDIRNVPDSPVCCSESRGMRDFQLKKATNKEV